MEECDLSPEEKLAVDRWMALAPPNSGYREILASSQLIEIPETSVGIWWKEHSDEEGKSRCYSCCLSDFSSQVAGYRLWSSPRGDRICEASCGSSSSGPHILRFVRLNQLDTAVQVQVQVQVQPSLF